MSSTMPTDPPPLQTSPLAPDEVAAALAAIDRIRTAADAAQCLERLFQATQAIGASASLYTVAIPEDGGELSSITLLACDPAMAHVSFDPGPMARHPWVRYARTHTTPGTEADIQVETATDAAALDNARRCGFVACLVIPTPAGADLGRFEMLCLGSAMPGAFESDDRRITWMLARALAAELHDWFAAHLRTSLQQAARLQAPDVELLALEWAGLSTKEIAQRTGLSIAAVDSRFQRLNSRLNCPNRRASARRLAEHGLLEQRAAEPDGRARRPHGS